MRLAAGIVIVPGAAQQVFSRVKPGLRTRPRGIFPLGFRRQAVLIRSFHLVELFDKRFGIFPRYLLDRAIVAARTEMGRIVSHDAAPLPLRHFRGLHIEGFTDRHRMRCLSARSSLFADRGSHRKCSRRNQNKFRSQRRAHEGIRFLFSGDGSGGGSGSGSGNGRTHRQRSEEFRIGRSGRDALTA